MRKLVVLLAVGLAVSGCAAKTVWVRHGATAADFEQDKARCEYEANLATPGSYSGRGTANAIADGINDGMRLGNLQVMCMRAKGWQQQAAPTEAVAANLPPPDANQKCDRNGVCEPLPMR